MLRRVVLKMMTDVSEVLSQNQGDHSRLRTLNLTYIV
jgi:hypothetical protein